MAPDAPGPGRGERQVSPQPLFVRQGDFGQAVRCPVCDGPMDSWTLLSEGPEQRTPRPGDKLLCVYCSTLLTYCLGAHGMTVRVATDAERAEADAVAAVPMDLLQQAAKAYRKARFQ